MSILDDAIREHLELKRAHGADEGELKRLEDEAFGPPQRPDEADPFAEAPTEFLLSPSETPAPVPEVGDEAARSGRRPDITDLQEAPPAEPPADAMPSSEPPAPAAAPSEDELSPAPDAPPPSPTDAADAPPPPPVDEAPAPPAPPEPGPTTEERHAIADQPTQMFDVQAQLDDESAAPTEQASPTDEELVDASQAEPQAAPPAPEAAPPTEIHEQPPLDTRGPDAEVAGQPPAADLAAEEESAEYDFFNEQRLSDELDQALEAPITDERALPDYEEGTPQGGVFDFESEGRYEEDPSEEVLRRMDEPASGEHEPPSEEIEPPSGEYDQPSEEFESPSEEAPHAAAEPPSEESEIDYDPDTGHEDVLEDTPRFLEDAPEDDDLWFEQKPPKDFDLD
ncbi:MAG TPA: hypothetical protein VMH33_01360 [Solirubrobacterales bacterium]|nr:hypothetical protein [Solirubrobacterales bacterium]